VIAALFMWLLIDLGSFNETHPVHRELVEAAEIYGGQWSTAEALQVAYCESRWNLEAVSQTKDHGAWQIHEPTWFDSGAFGPRVWGRRYTALGSASMAIEVYKYGKRTYGDGWILWSCR